MTPYEKVAAIETYLKNNYAYTNTPDETRGTSEDFVDRFLFEILEGYCDYFSTAMAVMVRTLDIPARWVKGYTSGAMDDESALWYEQQYLSGGRGMPEIEATYTVRNANAHSWVEVYFEGYGWVMFEPTAGFTAPVIAAPTEEVELTIDTIVTDSVKQETVEQGKSGVSFILIVVIGVTVLATLGLVWALIMRRSGFGKLSAIKHLMVRMGLMRPPANPNEQLIKEFNRLLQYLSRKGLTREDHQTVREVVMIWSVKYPSVSAGLQKVLHDFELAKYSRRSFTMEEVEKAHVSMQEIKRKMKEIA